MEFKKEVFSSVKTQMFAKALFHHCENTLICHKKTFQHIIFMLLNVLM